MTQRSTLASSGASSPRPGRLHGKRALVTGGDRGIGKGIAVRLAQEGADVAIAFHSHQEAAAAVTAQIEGLGRRALHVQADVSAVASIDELFVRTERDLGGVDILVNNAGIEKNAPFVDVTEEDYDRVLATNLKAVFFGSQAFARRCQQSGRGGRIVNVSSVHEELPFPHFAAYCAAKGGVRMLTRTLAIELAPLGIAVNGVAPGAIATEINQKLLADKPKLDALLAQIPRKRLGTVEDVAAVAAFLASDDADYVTGSTYFVDGGLTWFYNEQ